LEFVPNDRHGSTVARGDSLMRVTLGITAPRLAAGPLAVVLAVALTACGGGDDSSASEGSARERAFLSAMVPHHKSAVDMARIARRRASHAEIRELAHEIASTQELEIKRMKEIHRRVFGERLTPDDGAHAELGLSAEDAGMAHGGMAALEGARPFDRAFIDAMIPHHAGAIRMAEAVMGGDVDDEIVDLADGIVQAQSREIRRLNDWRRQWYGNESPAGGMPEREPEDGAGGGHEDH
jgi:uncharacterized protein (DUF305 family)